MQFRISTCTAAVSTLFFLSTPAQAQGYWVPPNFSGPPVNSYEPGIGVPLPGATVTEQNAALVWNLRAGLNVAALQCAFEPTLRTMQNYNALLNDHSAELASSFKTLSAYFKRSTSRPRLARRHSIPLVRKPIPGFRPFGHRSVSAMQHRALAGSGFSHQRAGSLRWPRNICANFATA